MPNSKTAEKNLWAATRKAVKVLGRRLHYTRIENSVSDSFPDVEFSLLENGINYPAYVELKTAARPAHFETNVAVHIRPGQVRWLRKRWCVRGAAWMLVQVGSGKDLARYLIPGNLVGEAEQGAPELWYIENSACDARDPLDRIVRLACTSRHFEE